MKTAIALRHVAFEDLGTWETVLHTRGYQVRYIDMGDVGTGDVGSLDSLATLEADLLVVLGGPMGVDQVDQYPFLGAEMDLVRSRVDAGLPTLGVCLGAQLIAAAQGAPVESGTAPEIGFITLQLADGDNVLEALRDVPVFSWHADQITLPAGATVLASTEVCACQAFAIGSTTLALQFHPELDVDLLDRWLIGHAHELATRGITPNALRRDAAENGARLRAASTAMLERWLDGLEVMREPRRWS